VRRLYLPGVTVNAVEEIRDDVLACVLRTSPRTEANRLLAQLSPTRAGAVRNTVPRKQRMSEVDAAREAVRIALQA
jgi:hypothetical protein